MPNWGQFAWEVTVIVWHSHGLCLLGESLCCRVAKRTLWLPLPFFPLSIGKCLLKVEGEFLKPTKASGRIQHISPKSAMC
jgi:hypothetical protein